MKHVQSSDLGIRDIRISEQADKKEVFFDHRGLDRPIPLPYESSGTKRLFHLLPQLYLALSDGIPAVLDEVDGDLHVDIAGEMLGWFRSQETNPSGAQLFVSSHNVGLLDNLEKEEVFIVEKESRWRDPTCTVPKMCAVSAATPVSIPSTGRGSSAVSRKSAEGRCAAGRSNLGESFHRGEGKSDQAFARFLGHCCQEAGLHLHLDVRPGERRRLCSRCRGKLPAT